MITAKIIISEMRPMQISEYFIIVDIRIKYFKLAQFLVNTGIRHMSFFRFLKPKYWLKILTIRYLNYNIQSHFILRFNSCY